MDIDKNILKTIAPHKTKYEKPLILIKGELIKLGERAPEKNWRDWIWAENSNKESGWIPIQIVDFSEDKTAGIVLENYSAKELNIKTGELVTKIKSINGWTWVKRESDNAEGWIPDETIENNS